MKTIVKNAVRICLVPFVWYVNRLAKAYGELFKGATNIPYFF
jgi:hypothetical protein